MSRLPGDTFAKCMRCERERQGLSQAEVARRMAGVLRAAVDPSTVVRIEQQTRAIRLDEAVAISWALGVPITALLSDDLDTDSRVDACVAELAIAQQEWEQAGTRVERLTETLRSLRLQALAEGA